MKNNAKVLSGWGHQDWVHTESEDGAFKLFVDGEYIACVQASEHGLIVVSTMHTVKLEPEV